MTKSTLLAAAAAAVTAFTLAMPAAQAQQDWRRGNFEERQGAHRFGEFCINRIVSHGFAHTSFFSGRDAGRKAEIRAIRSWENQVSERLGPQFASFARAQGKENRCVQKGHELECTISAHPCRERGPGPGPGYRR